MSALDKFYDFTLNLPDAKLTSKAMSLCNIDRNVFNIYLTLQEGKNNPILNADLGNYTVTMIVVKPKTKEYVEKVGVVDGSNDRLLFELGEMFNDQIGSYKGEIKVQNGNEVITSSSFAYTVTQSLISGLNAEIEASPDVEILRQLINEVKAVVGMTPGDPDSLLTEYQKKTDNTLTTTEKEIPKAINEVNSQIKDIKSKIESGEVGGNLINQNGGGILKIWAGTKDEFDALTITEDDVIYLVEGLNSETTITYNVTNKLTNCTNNNSNSIVDEQSSYSATITAIDGYVLSNVAITMGGTVVTSSVYADGIITISSVTGDIVITATAVEDTQNGDTFTLSTAVPPNMLNGNTGNGYIDTSGDIVAKGDNIYWEDYFEIDTLAKYAFITDSTNYYLAEYDESKTFIQRYKNSLGYVPSSNAKYIRVAIQNTVTASTYLYKIDNVIDMELGGIAQSDGSLLTTTKESRSVKFIYGINGLSNITLNTNAYFKVRFYDISQNFISTIYSNAIQNSSVAIPDDAYSMKLIIDGSSSAGIEITEELMNTYSIIINGIPYSFLLGV